MNYCIEIQECSPCLPLTCAPPPLALFLEEMGLFESINMVMDGVDDSAEEMDVVITLKEKNWYALRIGSTTSMDAGDVLRCVIIADKQ